VAVAFYVVLLRVPTPLPPIPKANAIDGSTGSVMGDPSRFHPPPQESYCEYIYIPRPRRRDGDWQQHGDRHRHCDDVIEPIPLSPQIPPLSPQTTSIAIEQPQQKAMAMPSPPTPATTLATTPMLSQEDKHQHHAQSQAQAHPLALAQAQQESVLQMLIEEVEKVDTFTTSATPATETTGRIEPLSKVNAKGKYKDIAHTPAYQYQYHSSYLFPRNLVVLNGQTRRRG
jgi:hypothetical protein